MDSLRQRRIWSMAKDPVCGMEVDPRTASYISEVNGETHYFCSESCMTVFNRNPAKFIEGKNMDHVHGAHSAGGIGCCGMGMMGSGWTRYVYLGIMLLYLYAILFR